MIYEKIQHITIDRSTASDSHWPSRPQYQADKYRFWHQSQYSLQVENQQNAPFTNQDGQTSYLLHAERTRTVVVCGSNSGTGISGLYE